MRVLTWNLFHGRSVPPSGHSLLPEFAAALNHWEWDVALLQEVPPWWPQRLAEECGAQQRSVLTSRNAWIALRRAISVRDPDLLKANGGGSNAILARAPIGEHRTRRLARWPERRWAHGVRLHDGTWVVNLHATSPTGTGLSFGHGFTDCCDVAPLARRPWIESRRAAAAGLKWAAGAPLVLAGDLNLHGRPELPSLRWVAGNHVDHLLAAGLVPTGAGAVLDRGTLSDHPPVVAELVTPS